jgi:hypothetical protein
MIDTVYPCMLAWLVGRPTVTNDDIRRKKMCGKQSPR